MPGREAWAKEMELAQKALELDPNLAEAHLSMGTALFSVLGPHDLREGTRPRRGIESQPGSDL